MKYIITILLIALNIQAYGLDVVNDPFELSVHGERLFFENDGTGFEELTKYYEDSGDGRGNLNDIRVSRKSLLTILKDGEAKSITVDVVSDRSLGSSIRIIKIVRVFNKCYALTRVNLVRRDEGWRMNGFIVELSGEIQGILSKVDDLDYKVNKIKKMDK